MNNRREKISMLMDGEEVVANEIIIDELLEDASLRNIWSRYHLIGDCLRGYTPDSRVGDISVAVRDRLQNEPVPFMPRKQKAVWLKPLAGFAIAASVVMFAVLGIQKENIPVNTTPDPVVATGDVEKVFEPVQSEVADFPTVSSSSDTLLVSTPVRLNAPPSILKQPPNHYLVNYNEHRSNGGIHGISSYVRTVSIETE